MQHERIGLFEGRIEKIKDEIKAVNARLDQISWLRLLAFVTFGALEVWSWGRGDWWWVIILIAGISVFLALVKWFERIEEDKNYLITRRDLNQSEIDRLEGKLSHFEDGGEYANSAHPYSSDLDVFGHHSLWQLLNRASTRYGKDTLAKWLLEAGTIGEIQERQDITNELAENIEWRERLQATGILGRHPGVSLDDMQHWLEEKPFFKVRPLYQIYRFIGPVLLLTTFTLGLMDVISLWYALGALALNGIVIRSYRKHGDQVFHHAEEKARFLWSFGRLIRQIEEESFSHPGLKARQDRLKTSGKPAHEQINRLSKILESLKLRLNDIPYFVMNYVFLWDIWYMTALENWKQKSAGKVLDWFSVIGEMEAFSSLAALRFARPRWSHPEMSEARIDLKGTEVGHPLLASDSRISNPVDIVGEGQIWLVTGSNMSGKSTYLRTVGLNVVLGLSGAVVCADTLTLSRMQVCTSMRTADSLEENTSSFFAELKRLRMVLEQVKKGELPVLFLLDEILKGTNSKDRHAGAQALIRQLHRNGASGIVSTHDIELVELERELTGFLRNYSFNCEVTPAGELNFDYRLTEGECRSMNATALMKNMGIEM